MSTHDTPIIHLYPVSPFSEKARLMMGYKGLSWRACYQPIMMPKPDLVALTGGYRQIPVMQIGADIYCGSDVIADELERRHPEPSYFRDVGPGIGRGLTNWHDDKLFWLAVDAVCGSGMAAMDDPTFVADRAEMLGDFDREKMESALEANIQELHGHLSRLEQQLGDGRDFLFGSRPNIVDIGFYHVVDFLGLGGDSVASLANAYEALSAWKERVAAIGHGEMIEISPADALAVARGAEPATSVASSFSLGPQPGDRVRYSCWAKGGGDIDGEVMMSTPTAIALKRYTHDLGDTIVHLPRMGATLR